VKCDVNTDVVLTENSCVTNDIMSSDVNEVTSLTDDGDDVKDDTVVDLDQIKMALVLRAIT